MNWFSKSPSPLVRAVRVLSPSCREVTRLQSRALDRPLLFFERLGLRLHLLLCRWCRRYGRQIAFLRDAAAGDLEPMSAPPPQKLSAEARERIRQRLLREASGPRKDRPPATTDSLN